MIDISMAELLAPLGENGAGEDMAFSPLLDDIKEARRADDAYLSQGEWEIGIKRSDWPKVQALTSAALRERSKDLQLAAWLAESLASQYGFAGLAFGLELIGELLARYWNVLYPPLDGDDLEERAARLAWVSSRLAEISRQVPLVDGNYGYGLNHLNEARQVENLARQNADAARAALEDGKINMEMFGKAVTLTPTPFYLDVRRTLDASRQHFARFQQEIDQHFGAQAPSTVALAEVLDECHRFVAKTLADKGVAPEATPAGDGAPVQAMSTTVAASPHVMATGATGGDGQGSVGAGHVPMNSSHIATGVLRTTPNTREEALDMLMGVAHYFRGTEPHSPVAHLVERAVRWGHMPLEEWLVDVIKDESVLNHLRETLGTQRRDEGT